MKILFTGMLSAHCKHPAEVPNKTFFVALGEVVEALYPSATIEWKTPSLDWTSESLSQYDLVFVGMVPPTSLSANMMYGSLKTLDLLYSSPRLRLVLDSGQLWQYMPSFNAISKDPTYLVSDFYSKRPGYRQANNYKTLSAFKNVADKFVAGMWPTTLHPKLPWQSDGMFSKYLPNLTDAIPLNLDGYFLQQVADQKTTEMSFFAVENEKSTWVKKLSRTVTSSFKDIKPTKKFNDSDALVEISNSIGLAVPPVERGVGTWWTYRYIQGLLSSTPIVTEWVESARIGAPWGVLAYQLEDMTKEERSRLAASQLETYLAHVPSVSELEKKLLVVLNSKGEVNA